VRRDADISRSPHQGWRTFLQTHLCEMIPVDFAVVPTVTGLLFVFVVLKSRAATSAARPPGLVSACRETWPRTPCPRVVDGVAWLCSL